MCPALRLSLLSPAKNLLAAWATRLWTPSLSTLCLTGPTGHLGRISPISEGVTNLFTMGTDSFRLVSVCDSMDAT